MFTVGDRVRLAIGTVGRSSEALGTVIGFDKDDVMVRWDIGVERALAPASLSLLGPSDRRASQADAATERLVR